MAQNLITTGTDAANSADLTLASGETATLVIRDTTAVITTLAVDQKDEAGAYIEIGRMQERSYVLTGPGTFRVRRDAGGKSCGVFRG